MKRVAELSTLAQFFLTAAGFVIVVAGMRAAQSILVPFLLALFIAVITAPALFWLKRKGVPTVLAMILLVAGILIVGSVMAVFVGTSVNSFVQALPEYQARLKSNSAGLLAWLAEKGVELPDQMLLEYFDLGAVMRLAANTLTELSGVLTNAFLILVTVIFMLLEASSFPKKMRSALGGPRMLPAQLDRFTDSVKRYMAIKTLISFLTGLTVVVWLTILGVDYAVLWGLLAFLLNYVPNIGSIIAAIPAVLLALVQLGGGTALLTAAGYVVIGTVVGNVLEPRLMGRGLGLSTLVVFLSLVFWGWVLGPVGMLLSVPLTMTLKIALESKEDTQWISTLLG